MKAQRILAKDGLLAMQIADLYVRVHEVGGELLGLDVHKLYKCPKPSDYKITDQSYEPVKIGDKVYDTSWR